MQIIKIEPIGFASNSYIVTADGKNAVVIDCAQPRVYAECIRRGLTPVAVLLTHGHYDHIGGCGEFHNAGVPIYCAEGEDKLIFSDANRAIFHDITIPNFTIARTLKDGEDITLAGITFKVLLTPGHTAGGACYLTDGSLFTGDTLFCRSVGRCDLETGNEMQLVKSVKKLYALDGDYTVYCGHGEDTTLDNERKFNPYIRN